jgi:hypothetical protein
MKMKPSEKYNFFYFLDFLTVPSKSRCRFFICQSVFLKMTERRKERKKKERKKERKKGYSDINMRASGRVEGKRLIL